MFWRDSANPVIAIANIVANLLATVVRGREAAAHGGAYMVCA